ncbi:ROK family transcriptional regulator [Nonomuraea wenchangensis]
MKGRATADRVQGMGSPQERIRRDNLAALLRNVHLQGSVTRSALAERLHVNRSTILTLSRELAGAGLIREESPHGRTPRPGRPSFVVRPGSDVYVLAFDVRADACTAARVRLGGDVLDRHTVPLSPSDPDAAAAQIAHAGRQLGRAAAGSGLCAGVGVAVPGPLERDGPGLLAALGAVRAREPYRGLPFRIGHDSNLALIAEHRRGAGVGHRSVLWLQDRDGLRGGVMIDGSPIGGEEGQGVDLGPLVAGSRARPCLCAAGMERLQSLYAPELIILGDGLGAWAASPGQPGPRIVRAALGADAVLTGAAELAFAALLADPIGVISRSKK